MKLVDENFVEDGFFFNCRWKALQHLSMEVLKKMGSRSFTKEENPNWQWHVTFLHWFEGVFLLINTLIKFENTTVMKVDKKCLFIVIWNNFIRVIQLPQILSIFLTSHDNFKCHYVFSQYLTSHIIKMSKLPIYFFLQKHTS